MSVRAWIETGRLQVAVSWSLGTGLLVASLLGVSLVDFPPDLLPVLATVCFAVSSVYLEDTSDETAVCVRRWMRRLRGNDAAAAE